MVLELDDIVLLVPAPVVLLVGEPVCVDDAVDLVLPPARVVADVVGEVLAVDCPVVTEDEVEDDDEDVVKEGPNLVDTARFCFVVHDTGYAAVQKASARGYCFRIGASSP